MSHDFFQPQIMGVVNVTPDSYHPDTRTLDVDEAVAHALRLVNEGASIIDIGGEATNPTLDPVVPLNIERARVVPVITALRKQSDVLISVDTSKPEIMKAAVDAGANIINDVRALRQPDALAMAAYLNVPVILMHMLHPLGHDVDSKSIENGKLITEIANFLQQQVNVCLDAGISREKIILDPGIGAGSFGKTCSQNLLILREIKKISRLGFPVLIGASRKTFIGELLGLPVAERLPASLAAAVMAIQRGASIIRTHDVKATFEAMRLTLAVTGEHETA